MSTGRIEITKPRGNSAIKVCITPEGSTIGLDIVEFIAALALEIRLPPLRFQSKTARFEKEELLRSSIKPAVFRVIEKMKADGARTISV